MWLVTARSRQRARVSRVAYLDEIFPLGFGDKGLQLGRGEGVHKTSL